jgi:hypothetical protein
MALALDDLRGRLYFIDGEYRHGYFDGATESLVLFSESWFPEYDIPYDDCIAVDDEGAIYVSAVYLLHGHPYILKCIVGKPMVSLNLSLPTLRS